MSNTGTMNVIDSTISDNQETCCNDGSSPNLLKAATGAGIDDQGTLSITGSTIAGNIADIYSDNSDSSDSSSGAGI